MNQKLSLLEHCIPCKSECCKTGKLIGVPILSKDEASRIKKVSDVNIEEITVKSGGKYYIFSKESESNKCFFLADDNRCSIQDIKPMDCLCYPIKAVYDNESVIFIIDTGCPAGKHLSNDFVENAKMIALKSLKRFDKKTYQHWLDNYIGWVSEELNSFKTKTQF